MILGDILALAMVGTWLLALDEYKAKLLAWGRTTFTLLAITGVATIIISYVFYSTAQIASKVPFRPGMIHPDVFINDEREWPDFEW